MKIGNNAIGLIAMVVMLSGCAGNTDNVISVILWRPHSGIR